MVDREARTRKIVEQFVYCLFRGEKMMPVLHYFPPSPPCRAVRLLGRMLNVAYDLRTVNIMEGDHLKPEYIAVSIHTLAILHAISKVLGFPFSHSVESHAHDSDARRSRPRSVRKVRKRINSIRFSFVRNVIRFACFSRAILSYLVAAYSKDDSLYPRDIRVRALVDQRLQFDMGTLYARLTAHYVMSLNFSIVFHRTIIAPHRIDSHLSVQVAIDALW